MIYVLPSSPDFAAMAPDLHQGLVLLLADGVRTIENIVQASSLEPDLTRTLLSELVEGGLLVPATPPPNPVEPSEEAPVAEADEKRRPTAGWVNLRRKAKKVDARAEEPYLSYPIFQHDLKFPPEAILEAVPTVITEADPGNITGDANEYYLLSRIDGVTTIDMLQSMTQMPMGLLIRRLVKHHHAGTVGFPESFSQRYLGSRNGDAADAEPAAEEQSSAPSESPGLTILMGRLVTDPSVNSDLMLVIPSLQEAGFGNMELGPKQLLVLSLINGEASFGEIAQNGPGDRSETLLSLLDVYRHGGLRLEAPARRGDPPSLALAMTEPQVPSVPSAGEDDDEDGMVVEMDYTTGEFSIHDFDAKEPDTAEVEVPMPGEEEAADTLADMIEFVDGGGPPGSSGAGQGGPAEAEPAPAPKPAGATEPEARTATPERTESTEQLTLPPEFVQGKELEGFEDLWTDPPHHGDLSVNPFEPVFEHIVTARLTGVLHCRQGAHQRTICVQDGNVVAASTDLAGDSLGSLLWKSEKIGKEDYIKLQKAVRAAPERTERELLDEMYLVVPDELEEALRLQVLNVASGLFQWLHGSYVFRGKSRLSSKLEMQKVSVEDIRAAAGESTEPLRAATWLPADPEAAREPAPEPAPALAPPPGPKPRAALANPADFVKEGMDRYVAVPVEAITAVMGLRVGEKERRLLNSMGESRYRLREILAMSSLGRQKSHQFVGALWTKGLIDLIDEVDQVDEALRSLEALNKWLVRMETGDLFHAIGSHASATGPGLQEAYRNEKTRFHPDRFVDRDDDFNASIDRVNVVMDRAFSVLKKTNSRRKYRTDAFGTPRLRGYAEVQYKKAEVALFFKQDYEVARSLMESAWDLVPDDPIYLAHYGYCHFRVSMPNKADMDRGVQMVAEALRMDSTIPQALLVGAMLEQDRGNPSRRQEYIDRARKLVGSRDDFLKLLKSYRLGGET